MPGTNVALIRCWYAILGGVSLAQVGGRQLYCCACEAINQPLSLKLCSCTDAESALGSCKCAIGGNVMRMDATSVSVEQQGDEVVEDRPRSLLANESRVPGWNKSQIQPAFLAQTSSGFNSFNRWKVKDTTRMSGWHPCNSGCSTMTYITADPIRPAAVKQWW